VAINSPSRPLAYLYSRKNIVGSLLALVGLALFFLGVIGVIWVAVVPALYVIGALVTPGDRRWDLLGGLDPDDLKAALNHQVATVKGKLPAEAYQKVLSIQQTVLAILPRLDHLAPGSQDLFILRQTATDYLPSTLQAYLNLPSAYAAVHRLSDGRTASQALVAQLTLLDAKLSEIADAVNQNDTDRLLANGRFLEDRFGTNQLTIK
jgi:hypothetical protein